MGSINDIRKSAEVLIIRTAMGKCASAEATVTISRMLPGYQQKRGVNNCRTQPSCKGVKNMKK